MKSKEVDVLTEARDLISDPEHWSQGFYARNKAGDFIPLDVGRDDFHSFCMIGALKITLGVPAVSGSPIYHSCYNLIKDAVSAVFPEDSNTGTMSFFNDKKTRKHEDVIAVYNKAIELAKGDISQ